MNLFTKNQPNGRRILRVVTNKPINVGYSYNYSGGPRGPTLAFMVTDHESNVTYTIQLTKADIDELITKYAQFEEHFTT